MHVLVTGAGGFVGRGLVQRLLPLPAGAALALGQPIDRLTLLDRSPAGLPPAGGGVHHAIGDFSDAALLDSVLQQPADVVFHLASVPGSLAEREPALGWQVNLLATLALARRLAEPPRASRAAPSSRPPRVVFASSVAVYGALGPGDAHEDSPPRPQLSYGAHKLMTEVLLADLSRRGELDAISLRLPGIVARPATETGHGSAFMSLLFHRIAAGETYDCPVSPTATAWWMSLRCCIDNLLHAARLPAAVLPATRTVQLPVLHAAAQDVVQALARRFGAGRESLIRWSPDERIEALFGRLPPLHTPAALAAGFKADADADALAQAG